MRITSLFKSDRHSVRIIAGSIVAVLFVVCLASCDKVAKRTSDSNQRAEASQPSSAVAQPVPSALPATPTPPQAETTPAPPPPIIIPAGTVITVHLLTPVGSKISQPGERFEASVARPVVVDGEVVIPKGASAAGIVTYAHPAGHFHGAATLGLRLDMVSIDGVKRPIHTSTFAERSKGKGKRTAGIIGGGAAGGAVIGALAGAGKGAGIGALVGAGGGTLISAFTGKRDIKLPVESVVRFKLSSSIAVSQTHPSATE